MELQGHLELMERGEWERAVLMVILVEIVFHIIIYDVVPGRRLKIEPNSTLITISKLAKGDIEDWLESLNDNN